MKDFFYDINERLNQLVQLRRERSLLGMPENIQKVLHFLPILFHYNCSNLPGYYCEDVSFGISNYEPTPELLSLLKNKYCFSIDCCKQPETPVIAGLYSMGSTSSLGQTVDSDLDIWVCIEEKISEIEKKKLQNKCRAIEQWAEKEGISLTLFIVDVNRFKDNYHDCLIGENCGSAQHMLLLEEFYRTANIIAGKLLLWYLIPSDFIINGIQYSSYDECVQMLVDSGAIKRNDWVDFGSLISLSAEEYFGASLWQLYKSIDSPYKAVLKTLLLEAYSWEYPNSTPISDEVKYCIHHDQTPYFNLDPYYMLLNKITTYLQAIDDQPRLELARRCFYIKVKEKLSIKTENISWRRNILLQLIKEWGWNEKILKYLDECEQWKIRAVIDANDEILNALMTSYRNLLSFGRRNNLESLVSPQDLTILTRKLYSAFEELPGKISLINPNISDDLSENALTFIHVNQDRINRIGWYVYNQRPTIESIVSNQYLKYSKNLVKLVGWAYFNDLISDETELHIRDSGNRDNSKLSAFIHDLRKHFQIKVPAATEEALSSNCEIRDLAVIVNLENDPTADLQQIDMDDHKVTPNVLSYGESEINLVGSIDLLYRNSWNEIKTLSFDGKLCVLEALRTLLNRMHKDANFPDSIEILCYSKYKTEHIKEQIKSLINKCINFRLSTSQQNLSKFKPLRIAGESWGLFFERLGVSLHRFENTVDFYGAISNNKLQGQALNIIDESLDLPKEIDSIASEGIIQFFFEDTSSGFNLYILNEHNQIEIYRNCHGNKKNMIDDINQYYTSSDDRFTFSSTSSVNFNLPQFYQITSLDGITKQIIPLN